MADSACKDWLQHNLGGNFSDGSQNATKTLPGEVVAAGEKKKGEYGCLWV
jgi:hypothetical protein